MSEDRKVARLGGMAMEESTTIELASEGFCGGTAFEFEREEDGRFFFIEGEWHLHGEGMDSDGCPEKVEEIFLVVMVAELDEQGEPCDLAPEAALAWARKRENWLVEAFHEEMSARAEAHAERMVR